MAEADSLTVANYTTSIVAWTLQLSMAMSALAVAILLFAHYGIVVMRILTEERVRQRQHVEAQFAKFLSPAVVANLLQSDNVDLTVEKRVITAFLVDLRGFTTFSDEHGSEAATERVNRFFEIVSEEILRRDGTIDKYLGDAVLAFWNAPLSQDNHADLAIETGLAIQARLTANPYPMEAVVTIESGECSVGNFGTSKRLDYTAVGGAMNLVARLESEAKARSTQILAGPGTAQYTTYSRQEIDQILISGMKGKKGLFVPLLRE